VFQKVNLPIAGGSKPWPPESEITDLTNEEIGIVDELVIRSTAANMGLSSNEILRRALSYIAIRRRLKRLSEKNWHKCADSTHANAAPIMSSKTKMEFADLAAEDLLALLDEPGDEELSKAIKYALVKQFWQLKIAVLDFCKYVSKIDLRWKDNAAASGDNEKLITHLTNEQMIELLIKDMANAVGALTFDYYTLDAQADELAAQVEKLKGANS
jgi:hypothetical protein